MHPILFTLGPITVYSYGVCVALAFLAAIVTAASRARRYGWKPELIYDVSFYILIAAVVGSRAFYVFTHLDEFAARPWEVFMVWRGGLVFYGGVFGAIVVAAFYFRWHHLKVAAAFDLLIPSVALGHAIGRVGCFLNGCCFGTITRVPWAVVFPPGSPAYTQQLYGQGVLPPDSAWSWPVHPVQLYEAVCELGIYIVLSLYLPRKRFDGEVFWLYFLLYGIVRFVIEFMRADNAAAFYLGGLGLSVPQIISLTALSAAALIIFRFGRQRRDTRARRCA
jgi:phosphatidylglycerol:prolipoprotein diacylglycerol transferase